MGPETINAFAAWVTAVFILGAILCRRKLGRMFLDLLGYGHGTDCKCKPCSRERAALAHEVLHEGDFPEWNHNAANCPCKQCLGRRDAERARGRAIDAARERERRQEEEERRWEARIQAMRVARERERVVRWEERLRRERSQTTQFSREPIPEHVRMFVWRRDRGKCVKCGSNQKLEFDHILPVSRGGGNSERNIQLLCETCNLRKGGEIAA